MDLELVLLDLPPHHVHFEPGVVRRMGVVHGDDDQVG
jgi:hypothetical protein